MGLGNNNNNNELNDNNCLPESCNIVVQSKYY